MLRSSSRPCGLHPGDPTQWMGGNRARAPGSPSPLMLLLLLLLLLLLSPLPFCNRLRQWGLNIPATIPRTLALSMRCCAAPLLGPCGDGIW